MGCMSELPGHKPQLLILKSFFNLRLADGILRHASENKTEQESGGQSQWTTPRQNEVSRAENG